MTNIKIDIYSKEDCSLCEVAKAEILKFKGKYNFQINEIDITKDSEIFEKFKYEIPVIFVNGKKLFKYKVEPERLEFHLNNESK
ncbi:MAG: glutaredoxin family protein [Calditrichaeota bacterium]|nr:MAG: glutaredoxin family protein [Calditrichota bacterium]